MKFPICKVCLKNDILCSGCTERINRESIPKEEVELYRRINKVLSDQQHLKEVEIRRIVGHKNFSLILARRDDVSKLIGKNGTIVKKLSKDLKKQVRVISENLNMSDFVKEVLFSTPVLGINVVYTPDSMKYRIRIPSSERVVLPIAPEEFSMIANTVFKKDAELVFE